MVIDVRTQISSDKQIVYTGEQPPPDNLRTVVIPFDTAILAVETDICYDFPPNELPRVLAVLDNEVPPWLDLLFGTTIAATVTDRISKLTQPTALHSNGDTSQSDNQKLPEDCEPLHRILCRFAQGLWMRRYWPASRKLNIPATSTFLTDLELVALSRHPLLAPLLNDAHVDDYLLAPLRTGVISLARSIDRVAAPLRPRVATILSQAIHVILDNFEVHDDLGVTEDDLEALLDTLDPIGAQEPAELSGGQFEALRPNMDYFTGSLSLVAGGSGTNSAGYAARQERSGTDMIDWKNNVHGLLDSGADVKWTIRRTLDASRPFVINVTVPAFPNEVEGQPPVYARIFTSSPLPRLLPLEPSRTERGWQYCAELTLDTDQVAMVDVTSVRTPEAPLLGDDRIDQKYIQEDACDWAKDRIGDVSGKVLTAAVWHPGTSTLADIWLAEAAAYLNPDGYLLSPEDGAGLFSTSVGKIRR